MQIIRIFLTERNIIYILIHMTKNRTYLLEILTIEKQPINASRLFEKTDKRLDLATIYRGLNYLEENNFITSFVFDCDDRGIERYYTVKKKIHEHYMHCEKCHSFTTIPKCPLKSSFLEIEQEYGFIVDEHFLTLIGVCRDCSIN